MHNQELLPNPATVGLATQPGGPSHSGSSESSSAHTAIDVPDSVQEEAGRTEETPTVFPPKSKPVERTGSGSESSTMNGSDNAAADKIATAEDLANRPEKSQALWRCLLNINKPAPAPRASMDDAPLIPLYQANFFSKLTYTWIQPIVTLGYQRFLLKEDLWRLGENEESEVLGERILAHFERRVKEANEWNESLANGTFKPSGLRKAWWSTRGKLGMGSKDGKKDTPGMYWAVSDTFKFKWWSAGFIKVAGDTLTTTSPLVTRKIITFGTQSYLAARGVPGYTAPPIGHGIGWAFLLFFMQISASCCMHFFFYQSMSVGVLSRGALIAALYRRALSLSGKARGTITNGKLINHISTDISRIDFAAGFFHMSWTAPIQLIVVVIILIVQMGAVSLAGVGFLLVATPAQGLAMRKLLVLRQKAMIWTDKRAKLIQELLGGMRIIKFFAWEIPYLERINKIRHEELKKIRSLLIIRALTMAVAMSLPVLATIIAFSAYTYTGNSGRDPAVIFTSLTLFNLLRMPLMMLPVALATAVDAKNAFTRIREVFLAEQVSNANIVDLNAKHAIEVHNGTFLWEGEPPKEIASKKKTKKEEAKQASKDKKAIKEKEKSALRPAPKKESKMPWKRSGNLAAQAQSANDAHEQEAMTGDVTDSAFPVPAPGTEEDGNSRPDAPPAVSQDPQINGVSFSIPRGQLCAIVGPVGAGKSSLLSALIGEMKRLDGTVTFGGTVGYCPQQAWIQNATVRNNILFGQTYDEKRYNKAIYDACLNSDLDMLPNGDMTEIGEKGITLSGGQKQRVNIARALYFAADITLFDDPLSAVDSHVGQHLFTHALQGAMAGRTRVLVTHALHFLPQVDNIITISEGRIVEQGTYNELLAKEGAFAALVAEFGNSEEETKKTQAGVEKKAVEGKPNEKQQTDATPKKAPKLMQEEERATGSVGFKVYKRYIQSANWYIPALVLLALILMQGASTVNAYTLVWWQEDQFHMSTGAYLGLYAATGVSVAFFTFFMGAMAALMGFNVSHSLHRGAIHRVLHAPMSLFDTTPLGRIMNRFSKDMDTVDNTLNDSMRMALSTLAQIFGSIILIAIVQQYFLIAVGAILIIYYDFFRIYRYSAREIKRLDNILRSSVYAHFSESLSGLATIRAYGEVGKFVKTNAHFTDIENRAYFLTIVNQRWLGIRLDLMGALLTFAVAIIAVTESTTINPSQIGLALTYVLTIQMSFTWAVRQLAEVENDMNSVERLLHYGNELEQEAAFDIPEKQPPKGWPHAGEIVFENVKLRYRPGLPLVLHGLSMHVKGGEKIGVVGRTGAGKSSLMQATYRITELDEGSITIDGHDLSKLGLNDVRKNIAIIPQDALLFSGTLRSNLDPFGEYDDLRLWDALRRSYLVDRQSNSRNSTEVKQSRFNLDMNIEDEGLNLSTGERSLVSLARALVKDSRVVILDEATASVDVATDSLIQSTIRTEFGGKTLLTIAHRLKTIISYDRVLVMDKGKIAEFATPLELFDVPNGIFRGMCEQSSITRGDIEKSRFETDQEIEAIEHEEEKAESAEKQQ